MGKSNTPFPVGEGVLFYAVKNVVQDVAVKYW